MPISTEWLALLVALLGVVTSGVIGYLVYSSNRQAQHAEMQREIGHFYDKLMDFRAAHPEVLKLSRQWNESCFSRIYSQVTDEDKAWVHYYTYAELCCGFANSVLYGYKIHLLDKLAYENHYQPLIKLLLTEHYPYLMTITQGKYISSHIRNFMSQLEHEGWDWKAMHLRLASSTQAVAPGVEAP